MEPLNILLVDDDADLGVMMKMRLSREAPDFSFRYVDSGLKCLEHLKDNPVDCILSDYQMPVMDGMQLLMEIKGRGVDVPFIFLTGQGSEQVARDAFKNGAYDYFTKDIGFAHFTRIINSVEQAVRQKQTHESRLMAEERLAKSNRDLRMLSECNQVLVRSKDERPLLDEVCRNIVAFGGYPAASVHFTVTEAPGTVRLVAHAGDGDARTDVVMPICSGNDAIMDPIGRVACTGEMFLANDIPGQGGAGRGGEDASGGCYASFIGLPLFIDSRPSGVLCIYGSCAGSFDDDEVRLLKELAADLSFGLQALRIREEKDRTVEALKASRIFLETIIDNEPECVKLIRPDGSLQMMNRAGLNMIQAESFEQVKDRPVAELIAPEHLEAFMGVGEKVFRGEDASLEFDMIGFKGRRLTLETHAVPLRDADGGITALLGVTRDVTEQRRVERELARSNEMLGQILDSVHFGMMVVGRDRNIRMVNKAAVRMMGYRSESRVVGRPCGDVICLAEGGRCPILDEGKQSDFSEKVLVTASGGRMDILKSVSRVRLCGEDVLLETFVKVPGGKAA